MKVDKNKEIDKIDIYFAHIPEALKICTVFPKERNDEINAASNERVKREKYAAWLLLEFALRESLGLTLGEAAISKASNGKWNSKKCEFSISHSSSCVVVAISHDPLGIDIEPLGKERSDTFAKKVLTEEEFLLFSSAPDEKKDELFLTRWCAKEAIFKMQGGEAFAPSRIETLTENVITKRLLVSKKEYVYAVACAEDAIVTEPREVFL